jgi:hypothetical protein
MQNQYFDLCILSGLLNAGETTWQKVFLLGSFGPKLSLPLVQSSFSPEYIVNAILAKAWAVAVPLGDDMVIR